MTERPEELDAADRAVLDDLFASALTTPDPGSTVDLDSILRAARAESAAAATQDDLPFDHDATDRPRGGLRMFRVLGGIAAAAALVFGVTQILPSSSGSSDSAMMSEMPARALSEPAQAEQQDNGGGAMAEAPAQATAAASGEESAAGGEGSVDAAEESAEILSQPSDPAALPAPTGPPDSQTGSDAAAPSSEGPSSEGPPVLTALGDGCPLPPAPVLSAAAEAGTGLTVVEISGAHGTGCEAASGFRVIGPTTAFDVLIGGPVRADAAFSANEQQLVQAVPLPGADAVDVAVAEAVVTAVTAALA